MAFNDKDRLEQILTRFAQQHAPQILMRGWPGMDDPKWRHAGLARRLAAYNILVLIGAPDTTSIHEAAPAVQKWVNGYASFYNMLTQNIYPSLTTINAEYADGGMPVIIAMRGEASQVMEVMAGYLCPYVVKRQYRPTISDVEIKGLMDMMLDEAGGEKLSREQFKTLSRSGMDIIKKMLLNPPLRQLPLTIFDRNLYTDTGTFSPPPPPMQ